MGTRTNALVAAFRAYVLPTARLNTAEPALIRALETWVRRLADEQIVAAAHPVPPPGPGPVPVGGVLGRRLVVPSFGSSPTPFDDKILAAIPRIAFTTYNNPDPESENAAKLRHYTDTVHGLFQFAERSGRADVKATAIAESVAYRKLLVFDGGRAWHRDVPVDADDDWIRFLYCQGQLDDFALTGNVEAKTAVLAMASSVLAKLPDILAATSKGQLLKRTERNAAFTLMALTCGAVFDAAKFGAAAKQVADLTVAWGGTNGFEHRLDWHDERECEGGGIGFSPFQTSLLVDALIDYFVYFGHPGVPACVARISTVLAKSESHTTDGRSYRYLVGCTSDAWNEWKEDLNPMILPVHQAAWAFTGAQEHLNAANKVDTVVYLNGLDSVWAHKDPKHFAQSTRHYLRGYLYRTKHF